MRLGMILSTASRFAPPLLQADAAKLQALIESIDALRGLVILLMLAIASAGS